MNLKFEKCLLNSVSTFSLHLFINQNLYLNNLFQNVMHVQRKKWVLIKNVAFLKVNFIFRPPPPPPPYHHHVTLCHFSQTPTLPICHSLKKKQTKKWNRKISIYYPSVDASAIATRKKSRVTVLKHITL